MSLSKTLILCLVLVQPRKTRPDMTEKNVDWDIKNQTKQSNTVVEVYSIDLICTNTFLYQNFVSLYNITIVDCCVIVSVVIFKFMYGINKFS